jgi:hypothetical protein
MRMQPFAVVNNWHMEYTSKRVSIVLKAVHITCEQAIRVLGHSAPRFHINMAMILFHFKKMDEED